MDSYGPICFTESFGEGNLLESDAHSGILNDADALSLAMMTHMRWPVGHELRIGFKGGTQWQKYQVKKYAPEWCQDANTKFSFVDSGELDILIAFDPSAGSWSRIGTDCRKYSSSNKPSMNLGWINDNKHEDDIRAVILHEFGHALGAVHEHSSPYAKIPWDREKVYRDLSGHPHYWDKGRIKRNMFQYYTLANVRATTFDPDSIMLYSFPDSWTTNGKGTARNTKLSASDKEFAKSCYPATDTSCISLRAPDHPGRNKQESPTVYLHSRPFRKLKKAGSYFNFRSLVTKIKNAIDV